MTFLVMAGTRYFSRADVLIQSIKKHHPDDTIEFKKYYSIDVPVGQYIPGFHKHKYETILELLEQGHKKVVFMGSDTEIFSPLYEIENLLGFEERKDIVLVPHVKNPVDREQLRLNYIAGHINSDFIAIRNSENTRNILKWLIEVVEDTKEDGTFYDQTWLSSLPFLFPNVKILRHPGYNVGYWDVESSGLINDEGSWLVKEPDEFPCWTDLRFFHYSGYEKGNPCKMSKHSDKLATGDVLKLFEEYDRRI